MLQVSKQAKILAVEKFLCFFFFFFTFFSQGGTGIPPSTGGPDGAVTPLKLGGKVGGGGKGAEDLLRSRLENRTM